MTMSRLKQKTILDNRIVFRSLALLVIFFIPVTYVHELGHAMVCSAEGHEYKIAVGVNGGYTICSENLQNVVLYRMMGGTLATVVVILPLVHWQWIRKNPSVLIVSLSFATGNAFNAIIETLAYQSYMHDRMMWNVVASTLSAFIFIGFVFAFARNRITINLPVNYSDIDRWQDLKEKFIVFGIMTGVFLPARLIFYTYVSQQWLGSLGLVSSVAILMLVLIKKKKLGWFGPMFERQMRRVLRAKMGKVSIAIALCLLIYFGMTILLIERGNTIYVQEKEEIYNKLFPNNNISLGKLLSPDFSESFDLQKQGELWITAFLNFDNVFSITYAIINQLSNGWVLHLHTVVFVEQIEIVALLFFYRFVYRQKESSPKFYDAMEDMK